MFQIPIITKNNKMSKRISYENNALNTKIKPGRNYQALRVSFLIIIINLRWVLICTATTNRWSAFYKIWVSQGGNTNLSLTYVFVNRIFDHFFGSKMVGTKLMRIIVKPKY